MIGVLVVALSFFAPTLPPEGARRPVPVATAEDLVQVVKSRDIDLILATANELNQMHTKSHLLPTVDALWRADASSRPDWPIDVIMLPTVRLAFANVLIQSHRNGLYEADVDAIQSYAREQLGSGDYDSVMAAMSLVAMYDDNADVTRFIALSKQESLFRPAVVYLGSMCNPEAKEAVHRLLESCDSRECVDLRSEQLEQDKFQKRSGQCDEQRWPRQPGGS